MEKNLYVKIRNSRPVTVWDIFIYVAVAILLAALFLGFTAFSNKSAAAGFKILYKEQSVFTFYYAERSYIAENFDGEISVKNNGDIFTVTVLTGENKNHYNVLTVDANNCTTKCSESNCSLKKDCVHTAKISGSGAIICLPHNIKILPLGDGYIPVTTG